MSNMFSNCSSLKELNLFSFNTNEVIDMSNMFSNCSLLKELNVSSFNTCKVFNMDEMFSNCLSLKELDLTSFNINNVSSMDYMFYKCPAIIRLVQNNFEINSKTIINNHIMHKNKKKFEKKNKIKNTKKPIQEIISNFNQTQGEKIFDNQPNEICIIY